MRNALEFKRAVYAARAASPLPRQKTAILAILVAYDAFAARFVYDRKGFYARKRAFKLRPANAPAVEPLLAHRAPFDTRLPDMRPKNAPPASA